MQLLRQKSSLNNYKDYLKNVKYRDVEHYFSKHYLNNHTQKAYPNTNLEERNQINYNYNLINNSNHYLMNNKASNEEVVNYNKPFAKIHGDNSEFIQ